MNKQDKKQAVQPSDLGLDVAQLTSAAASPFSLPFLWGDGNDPSPAPPHQKCIDGEGK